MSIKLDSNSLGNAAKNAWNQYNQMHCCQTWVLCLYTFSTSIWGSIISFFASHIYFFRSIAGIFYLDLIHKAKVIDLNLTISLIPLSATFSLYSKLFYIPISFLLKVYSLINIVLDMVIFFSFLKKMLYKINKLKWLKKIIVSTQAPTIYKDIVIKKEI